MKTLKNVYSKIYDIDNLRLAHRNASKDKVFYKEVRMVNKDENHFLFNIQKILKNKTYHISKKDYTIETIFERWKLRELWKTSFYPHSIIQHAIMQVIWPMLYSVYTSFSCASIKWMWWKRVQELMRRYLKDKEWTRYCLKIDITKYYPNINHAALKRLLRKKIKDTDLLRLLDMIIDSYPGKKWLPIWSYLSQHLANFYLSYFDHWLKEVLHIKYVIRYMDDIVILSDNKTKLRVIFRRMKKYLSKILKLKIKWNYQIFPVDIRWIDFVWYRYFHWFILLRKWTATSFKRKASHVLQKQLHWQLVNFRERSAINSYAWWLIHCDSYRLYKKYITPIVPTMVKYYYYIIANKSKKKTLKYKANLLTMQWYKR